MASPTLAELCSTPTGAADADRNSAILAVAKFIGLPATRGALSNTNHPFIVRTITNERIDGDAYGDNTGSDRLLLNWFPVLTVTALTDWYGTALSYTQNTDYVIEDIQAAEQSKWTGALRMKNGIWPIGRMNLKVSYTAGLTAAGDVPAELTEAIRITALAYAYSANGTLSSVSLGERSYTFDAENNGQKLPQEAADLLGALCRYPRL